MVLFKNNICKYSDIRQLKVISCFDLYISECCHCSDYFVLIRIYFSMNKCKITVLKDEKNLWFTYVQQKLYFLYNKLQIIYTLSLNLEENCYFTDQTHFTFQEWQNK